MIRNPRFRLIFFPCVFLILLVIIGADNWQVLSNHKKSLVYTYVNSFAQGKMGSGYGTTVPAYAPFDSLKPGDIILGGWPNCAYGKYSHAGLYMGDDQVLESYVDYGVTIQPLTHYADYTYLCLLRVEASQTSKEKVIARARTYEGQLFYPLAFKQGHRYWNCSKIIWKAYADQGIDLDINQDIWIAPESFRDARNISRIYERGTN